MENNRTTQVPMSSLQRALLGDTNGGAGKEDDVRTHSPSSVDESKASEMEKDKQEETTNDSPMEAVAKTGKNLLDTVTRALTFEPPLQGDNDATAASGEATDDSKKKTKIHPTVHSVWRNILSAPKKIGDIWDSSKAYRAFHRGKLASKSSSSQAVRVVFRNLTCEPVVVGWVNHNNALELYTEIPPQPFPDKHKANDITKQDYVLNTTAGHTFAIVICDDFDEDEIEDVQDFEDMIGAYRPLDLGVGKEHEEFVIHLITIEETHEWVFRPCKPSGPAAETLRSDDDVKPYSVHSRLVMLDDTPVDSTSKAYTETDIGGWKCFVEEDWYGGDEGLKQRIVDDLTAAKDALPEEAREFLIKSTPFYLNKSMEYGPVACPINGTGLCYHPDEEWLENMGMSTDKKGCIELYDSAAYKEDCDDWGPGGAFLHELAHAYQDKVVEDGFDNDNISRCYAKAMKEGLYDRVLVKADGEMSSARAYACVDASEYFAELSTAFLGGLDKEVQFNKWEPFNRDELMKHDPRAYRLMQRMWKVTCAEKAPRRPSKVPSLTTASSVNMSKKKLVVGSSVADGA